MDILTEGTSKCTHCGGELGAQTEAQVLIYLPDEALVAKDPHTQHPPESTAETDSNNAQVTAQ